MPNGNPMQYIEGLICNRVVVLTAEARHPRAELQAYEQTAATFPFIPGRVAKLHSDFTSGARNQQLSLMARNLLQSLRHSSQTRRVANGEREERLAPTVCSGGGRRL